MVDEVVTVSEISNYRRLQATPQPTNCQLEFNSDGYRWFTLAESKRQKIENEDRLTLFVPAYFDVSDTRGGHIVPPLNIFGFGRVRVPILFGNYLHRNNLPYSKGFMKLGCPEPSKKLFDF